MSKLEKDFTQVIIRFKVSNIPYEIFNIGLNGDLKNVTRGRVADLAARFIYLSCLINKPSCRRQASGSSPYFRKCSKRINKQCACLS